MTAPPALPEVSWHQFEDELVCTERANVVAYLRSLSSADRARTDDDGVGQVVEAAFARGGGVLQVTKDVGLFVCRRPYPLQPEGPAPRHVVSAWPALGGPAPLCPLTPPAAGPGSGARGRPPTLHRSPSMVAQVASKARRIASMPSKLPSVNQ